MAVAAGTARLAAQAPGSDDAEHRAIFKELVELNTSPDGGDVSRATRAVERRLLAAGYAAADVAVVGPSRACENLVATLAGADRKAKPLLLLAHLDVVPARRADWTFDPYVLREEGGWFYGRGAVDNKAGASVLVANMARWKRDGFVPARDVVMVLTCDEEGTADQGMRWLLAEKPRLREADYALNTDAGGVSPTSGGRIVFAAQAAEKVYATFALSATNPGGHSSVPRADNAIYALAAALQRLAAFTFPVELNDVSRAMFARTAEIEAGAMADDLRAAAAGATAGPAIDRLRRVPHLDAQLRTTCVATMLAAGHAENALPQSATATVNCRIVPGTDIAAVESTLARLTADLGLTVTVVYAPMASPPSPLRADVMRTIERLAAEQWPASVVVPEMSAGATDGLFLRNAGVPVYGVSALLMDPADDRSHGLDERVPVASLYAARLYWDRLVRALSASP
jgi:acetylornithine deacetylase/succinyl-diaminopimelate desuccinylase-like protein